MGRSRGQDYDFVIPRSTILIENPVAVIDAYADKHGVREIADGFLAFLQTREAQQIFAEHGLRSVDQEIARANAKRYPPVDDLFTIGDFGGWPAATSKIFGDAGVFGRAMAEVQGR